MTKYLTQTFYRSLLLTYSLIIVYLPNVRIAPVKLRLSVAVENTVRSVVIFVDINALITAQVAVFFAFR